MAGCVHTEASTDDGNDVAGIGLDTRSAIVAEWPVLSRQPRDAAIEARVTDLVARMTIEQKVGQIIQADNLAITPEEVRDYHIGSVLSGGNSGPGGAAYGTAAEWIAEADAFYHASLENPGEGVAIPVIWGIDAVHGHNNVIGGTIFPHNIGLGAARDTDLIRRIASATAKELRVTGHEWTFAPTLAVPQDDRWGRTYEGYSEDPSLVAEYTIPMVEGLQGRLGSDDFLGPDRVISTAKHFAGDGGTEDGRDQGDALISPAELAATHGAGYAPAIEAGVQSIMASFSSWNGMKLHGHEPLLTGALRERMGFDGFVVGDWNGHGQVAGCENVSCAKSVNAGLDMFMAPDSWRGLYDNTLAQVKSGEISTQRLDEAVASILRVKLRAGIFEAGPPSTRKYAGDDTILGSPEHRALAREAVRKSLVLLKNQNGLLPLNPTGSVLVAGDGADSIAKMAGGWTLTWQGGVANDQFPKSETILDGIQSYVSESGGTATFSETGSYEAKPDVAIVVFGENPYAEFQGDLDNLAYRSPQGRDLALLQRLRSEGVPVVAVFLSGRPMWVNPHINASDAFVAAWLPGTEGGGVSDVLFRSSQGNVRHDFQGRLSYSWPAQADDYGANTVNGEDTPLFDYGYGLSYASAGDVPALSEDPGVEIVDTVSSVYFERGNAVDPLQIYAGDDLATAQVMTLPRSQVGSVSIQAVETETQDDSLGIIFDKFGALALQLDDPLDIQRQNSGLMALSMRVLKSADFAVDKLQLGMGCGLTSEACRGLHDITDLYAAAPLDKEIEISIRLQCFANDGADMSAIRAPFVLQSDGTIGLVLLSVGLTEQRDTDIQCPN